VVGVFDSDAGRLTIQEVHRFPNVPVRLGGTLYWDFLRLYGDVVTAIARGVEQGPLQSVGIDGWGVDFGLLDGRGRLLGNPVHYRDGRTAGMLEHATQRVPRERLYAATGIQFLPINTLYQLLSLVASGDPDLERAEALLMVPDLINHFLCGSSVGEYTNATTTQCFDVRAGAWATDVLASLGIPERIFPRVVPPGTVLGPLLPDVAGEVGATNVQLVAPGTHDTASAVAGTPLEPDGSTAYLSSGTWSLLGLELNEPVLSQAALEANLTNEGGVGGSIRLLKNIMGLWLVQEARRALGRGAAAEPSYAELSALAEQAPAHTAFVDPDDERFLRLRPGELPGAVEAFCIESGQPPPADPGTLLRVLFESLALKYAWVVRQLERVAGRRITSIRVVGGGAQNELLCRLTAGATTLPVLAGPAEATAIGNLLVQAIGTGRLGSLAEGRELVSRSFPAQCIPAPAGEAWTAARERFDELLRAQAAVSDTGGRR
jgi:rhamnulokinase